MGRYAGNSKVKFSNRFYTTFSTIWSHVLHLSILCSNGDESALRWFYFHLPLNRSFSIILQSFASLRWERVSCSECMLCMLQEMTMMFEVQDLAVASPATVSRCGMVYLEPVILGLRPFVECWLNSLPDPIYLYKEKMFVLFRSFLEVSKTRLLFWQLLLSYDFSKMFFV